MTNELTLTHIHKQVDAIYRTESRRIFATLIRLLGDFDLAEDALHDAFRAAIEQWPLSGIPANPRPWLVSTGRFKAIDKVRRRARFDAAMGELASQLDCDSRSAVKEDDEDIEDDRLRLIFTCCHPALSPEARVALTLREVCGLTTDWAQIIALYDMLTQVAPSPIIEINRAVAVAMRDGPAAGLEQIEAILARGDLANYHLAHSARGDLYKRLGKTAEARAAYQWALTLAQQEPERRFLERQLASLRD